MLQFLREKELALNHHDFSHFQYFRIRQQIRNFAFIAENAIRPYTLGRKAWLFSNTEGGAETSAFYYSLVETAKANNINVFDYLWYCLSQAPLCRTENDWEALLPWNMDNEQVKQMKSIRNSATPDPTRIDPYVLRGAN